MSGNPSELFDPIEETFDEVAVLVPVAIIFALLDAVVARGDDGLGPEGLHLPDEAVSVIRPVGDHPLGTEALKQRRGLEMSVAAWNLVVSPPQERPMACGSSIFLSRPRAVLVDTDDRAVGDELLQVHLPTKPLNNLFPNPFFRQAVKPHVHRVPLAELPGQVALGSARVLNPQHGLHKQAVVPRRHPRVTLPARKQVLDGLPLVIAQKQSQDGLVPEKPLVSHASG